MRLDSFRVAPRVNTWNAPASQHLHQKLVTSIKVSRFGRLKESRCLAQSSRILAVLFWFFVKITKIFMVELSTFINSCVKNYFIQNFIKILNHRWVFAFVFSTIYFLYANKIHLLKTRLFINKNNKNNKYKNKLIYNIDILVSKLKIAYYYTRVKYFFNNLIILLRIAKLLINLI